MKLNKLKLYIPTSSGGGAILDQPFSTLWSGDSNTGRSANSIYNLIQSLGKLSRIIVVDSLHGNDYSATPPQQSGERESLLRPFKDINVAIYYMLPGDTMIVMPGSYTITNYLGLVPKTNCSFFLVNANLTYSGVYSPFFIYPQPATGVRVIGIGNSTITKTARNGWGGVVTPYTGISQIEFHNLQIYAPEQAFGGLGASGSNGRIIDFYNCRIYQTDSQVLTWQGGGAGSTSSIMKNCYIFGYTYLASGPSGSRPQYNLMAIDCFFEANNNNFNGKVNCLDFGEYYEESSDCKLFFERCTFKSDHHAIETGLGYGGLGINKKLIFYDCKFVTGIEGWIVNNHPDMKFKLINNYATTPATGSDPVVNSLLGLGITIEPDLEVYSF